jgi:translation initiation factor IF-2
MSKLRVYELARELNIESKLMVTRLKQLGVEVASHQSVLTDEQVKIAREGLSGGRTATAAPAASAVVSGAGASKTVVIRRRRPADEEPTPSAPVPAAIEEVKPVEPPQVQVQPPESQTPAQPQVAAAPQVEIKERAEVAPPAPVVPVAPVVAAEPAPKSTPVSGSTFVRDSSGSATIVRRATPEELEARARRREAAAAAPKAPTGPRREDSRGTRITGPAASSGSERVTAIHSATHEEANRTWARKPDARGEREKVRTDEPEESEESLKLKLLKQQKRQKPLNPRFLLEQLDPEAEVEETEDARNRKTVFTPEAANRKKDLKRRKDLKKTQITTPRASKRIVEMGANITVGELARQLSVKGTDIIKKLMDMGMMVALNAPIDFDTVVLIASEYNFEVKSTEVKIEDILKPSAESLQSEKFTRPPIVTVMGHVDHGKTSILDAIRKTNVTAKEAGGITQHIGAYSVEHNGKRISFLDTPGHEAFSSMRARGANLTDIVILVVAADDGVMPQTIEAISHARAANVPIIVAVNKMDKHGINLDRLFNQLSEHGIQSEEWGGENQFVKCSAIKGDGIPELLEAILLQAEVLELQASILVPADAVVVEAHIDKGRGPVATLMVRNGVLRKGDYIVAGSVVGRVRAMADHTGALLESAGPSTPVEVLGLADVPMAGDQVNVVEDERRAKEAAGWRIDQHRRSQSGKSSAQSLQDLLNKVNVEGQLEVPFILKGDTQGSVEAIAESIAKVTSDKIRNKIIHQGVGGITESDITLAQTANAVIIGFNVRAAPRLENEAERQGVIIQYFDIIYNVVDSVRAIMAGRLPPVRNEVVVGHAQVRNPIKIPKIGVIAGSAVLDGRIPRSAKMRLIRDDVVIYDGKIGSLRRFKDDVSEVVQGYECGIALEGYNDLREGDVLEAYVIEEKQATL